MPRFACVLALASLLTSCTNPVSPSSTSRTDLTAAGRVSCHAITGTVDTWDCAGAAGVLTCTAQVHGSINGTFSETVVRVVQPPNNAISLWRGDGTIDVDNVTFPTVAPIETLELSLQLTVAGNRPKLGRAIGSSIWQLTGGDASSGNIRLGDDARGPAVYHGQICQ